MLYKNFSFLDALNKTALCIIVLYYFDNSFISSIYHEIHVKNTNKQAMKYKLFMKVIHIHNRLGSYSNALIQDKHCSI